MKRILGIILAIAMLLPALSFNVSFAAPTFREDFDGITAIGESANFRYLRGSASSTATIEDDDGNSVFHVDAYATQAEGTDYTEKSYVFISRDATPANYRLEFRFKVDRTGGWPCILMWLSDNAAGDEIGPLFAYRYMGSGDRRFCLGSQYDSYDTSWNSTITLGRWYTVIVTVYEGKYTMYVDGVNRGTLTLPTPRPAGYIQVKAATMDVTFDYFDVSPFFDDDPLAPALKASVSPAAVGNIYTTNDNINLGIEYTNKTANSQTIDYSYEVKDYNGIVVDSGFSGANVVEPQVKDTASFPIITNRTGIFTTTVTAKPASGAAAETASVTYSRVLPTIADRVDTPFATCAHYGQGKGDLTISPYLQALGGIAIIRDDCDWKAAETTRGVITIPASWDNFVNAVLAQGIEPLLIFAYGNSLYDGGGIPYTDEGRQANAAFCAALVEHFKGRVRYYEYWNEPNISVFNPTNRSAEDYTAAMKVVYEACKAVDPNCVILGGSLSQTNTSAQNFIRRMMNAGAYGYMDAFSIHPYCYPATWEANNIANEMQTCYNIMNEVQYRGTGPEIPMWSTELGWPTQLDNRGVSEDMSAALQVRANALMLSLGYVDKLFTYDFQNDGNNRTYNEDNFGTIRWSTDPDLPWGAKSSFVAQNIMANMLYRADFINGRRDGQTYQQKFRRAGDGKDVVVAWNATGSRLCSLPVGDGTFIVYDMFGNGLPTASVNGAITISLSEYPVYIEGAPVADPAAPGAAMFTPNPANLDAAAAGKVVFTIDKSGTAQSLSGEYNLILPPGWTVDSGATFAASARDTITVSISFTAKQEIYNIKISPVVGGVAAAELLFQVNVTNEPVKLAFIPAYEGGQWYIDATITNIFPNPMTGKAYVSGPSALVPGGDPSAAAVAFGPVSGNGGTEVVRIPVDNPGRALYSVVVTAEVDDFQAVTATRATSFLRAEKAPAPLAIDGVLDAAEWGGAQSIVVDLVGDTRSGTTTAPISGWGGADDLSMKLMTKWDDDYLYLGIEVTDDVHYQAGFGGDIWSGDSIQFSFDPGRAKGINSEGYNEIGMALNSVGGSIESNRWTAAAGNTGAIAAGLMNNAIVRNEDEKTTVYESAVSWDLLLVPGIEAELNSLFGISILANENDGDSRGRRGWIQYMDGIGGSKSPALFADLLLVDENAYVTISGPDSVVSGAGATATYTISAKNMPTVGAIDFEIEVDGDFLSSKSFTFINGFKRLSAANYGTELFWTNVGNIWTGKAILYNPDLAGVSGNFDIFAIEFGVAEGKLGITDVKLNYADLSFQGIPINTSIAGDGIVYTELLQWYSRFDLNKDGVIDLNDLTYALLYLGVTDSDPEWVDAEVCDVDPSGSIDINDLILILANYTIPYYS